LRNALRLVADLSDDTFAESRHFRPAGDRRLWHSWADVERFNRCRADPIRFTLALP
jgi:hypothetical protein